MILINFHQIVYFYETPNHCNNIHNTSINILLSFYNLIHQISYKNSRMCILYIKLDSSAQHRRDFLPILYGLRCKIRNFYTFQDKSYIHTIIETSICTKQTGKKRNAYTGIGGSSGVRSARLVVINRYTGRGPGDPN